MAGYIYCMKNNHRYYGQLFKIGYTERRPADRACELGIKWRCTFEVLWDIDVYEPARAERFLHEFLHKVRVRYEFFAIDPEDLRQRAEEFFDQRWRETEDQETLPPSLDEQAAVDASGQLLEADEETLEEEARKELWRDMDERSG